MHYLITYAYRRKHCHSWYFYNTVTAEPPIDWLLKTREYDDGDYTFLFALAILPEEAEAYMGYKED
jgi:hypothetical protein